MCFWYNSINNDVINKVSKIKIYIIYKWLDVIIYYIN